MSQEVVWFCSAECEDISTSLVEGCNSESCQKSSDWKPILMLTFVIKLQFIYNLLNQNWAG